MRGENSINSVKKRAGGGGICKFENAFRSFVFFYLPGTPEKKKSVGTYIRIFTVNIVDYLCTVPSGIFGREYINYTSSDQIIHVGKDHFLPI
jgi:hypothetical protein